MVALAEQLAERLALLYADGGDVEFADFLASARANVDDEESIAELIDADGRLRLQRGLPVELARYMDAVPALATRRVALDAAIEFALRSLSDSGMPSPAAIETLTDNYPELATAIRAASVLSGALWSTERLRSASGPVARPLPAEFGPPLPNGSARFELRELLGSGAHGAVYLAADRLLSDRGRPAWVAIKVLREQDVVEDERARLIEEATRARRINHPNVVRVLDRGVAEGGSDYIVYEYVDGRTLRAWLEGQSGPLEPRAAASLVVQVARGVQAAHCVAVVHCDIKPDNVLVTRAGDPKLADFGLAVRIGDAPDDGPRPAESAAAGNLAFIAPEQYRMEEGAFASPADIYALGGLLFYLLTRSFPNGQTVDEAERYLALKPGDAAAPHLSERRPEVDPDLEAICRRALAVRATDRYGSAEALANDLEAWLRLEPIAWSRPSRRRRLRLFARRQPFTVAAIVTTVAVVGLASGLGVRISSKAEERLLRERVAAAERLKSQTDDAAERLKARTDEWYKRQEQNLSVLANVWRANAQGATSEQWLSTLTVLESLAGPKLLTNADDWGRVWSDRIARVKSIVADAKAAGRGSDVETLLWQSALGYWMLRQGDFAQADRTLSETRAAWATRLDPSDGWLAALDLMRAGCTIKQLAAASTTAPLDNGALGQVREAVRTIETVVSTFDGRRKGSAMHRLALECLVDAYSPGLLDDPTARASADYHLRQLRR